MKRFARTIAAETVERQMLSGLSVDEAVLLASRLKRCAVALDNVGQPDGNGDEMQAS